MKRIVFRADAGAAIGSGHVMRCLALSQAFLADGWLAGFAGTRETFKSVNAIEKADIERLILDDLVENEPHSIAAHWPNIDVLVVDHYGRDAKLERSCRPFAKRIVVIDDLANRLHDCDLLVDSSTTSEASYRDLVPASCHVLVGPSFAPLAREFRQARPLALSRRDGRSVEHVLLSFGQIDPQNATELVLDALDAAGYTSIVDIAIGSAAPHLMALRKRTNQRIKLHIDNPNMSALMSSADLAIGAGGTTSWERCCLGLPSLILEIASNQRGVIATIEQAKAGIGLGSIQQFSMERVAGAVHTLLADDNKRMQIAMAGANLVDGRGIERIMEMLI
jgi:UDP-2,4-diacetamido-2,4,6-trideoxy-beta-L-altropyranose hydrolase